MPILNYTTKVAAAKTVGELQAILVKHKVMAIQIEFDTSGNPVALKFSMLIHDQPMFYKLPCNYNGVLMAMKKSKSISKSQCTNEQALRVAWRILKDWVEAQFAIVEAKQMTVQEVFFSRVITPTGETIYERFENEKFKMLQ